ncbi:hypothetical protein HOE67_05235 [Candidatus Peregrinibacteria bacterium]|jgi:hypothetical protein|nr:hypothetical protein [Candidatus Peregrinibacteria bacterium]MBT4056486.1 hypothetical protein [Candidatus Peregrinibacteria bacterium]
MAPESSAENPDNFPLQEPCEFAGDRNGYCDHIEPEVDYLLGKLEKLDAAREAHYLNAAKADDREHSLEPIGDIEEPFSTDPHLDARAKRALGIAMDYFAWEFGNLIGVDKEDRQYLRFDDLDYEKFSLILSSRLPEHYKKLGFELYRRMTRGDFSRALFVPYESPDVLETQLASVCRVKRDRFLTPEARTFRETIYGPDYKLVINEGEPSVSHETDESGFDNRDESEALRLKNVKHQYIGLTLETIHQNFPRGGNPEIFYMRAAYWLNSFAHNCYLNVDQDVIERARLVKCRGKVAETLFDDTIVVAGADFSLENCAFMQGELVVNDGLKLESTFFHGTKIRCERDDVVLGNVRSCDFSSAEIDNESLCKIAEGAERCIFSREQSVFLSEQLGASFGDRNPMVAEEIETALDSMFSVDDENLAGPESDAILRSRSVNVVADHLDPQRNVALVKEGAHPDLEDVPVLRRGNDTNEGRVYGLEECGGDLRKLFPMLGSKENARLAARLRVFPQIFDFLKTETNAYNIPAGKWVSFIKTLGADACLALGLDPVILELEIDVDKLPQHGLYEEQFRGDHRQSLEGRVPVVLKNFEGFFLDEEFEFDGDKIPKCVKKGKLTIYARLQILSRQLVALEKRLRNYKSYCRNLGEKSYSVPEFVEGSDVIKLKGVYHPNVPAVMRGKGQGGEPVGNDIELKAGEDSVIAVTAKNAAGKTFMTGGVIEMVAQAQAGSPCSGEVEVGSEGMYDHSLYMSTRQATPGGSESGLEARADVLKKFLAQVDSVSGTAENPTRVLIGLDEIVKDATNPEDAALIEYNLIKSLMERPDVKVTILMVSHNLGVLENLRKRFPENTTILAPDHEQDYRFVESDTPAKSDPGDVFERADLGFLLKKG